MIAKILASIAFIICCSITVACAEEQNESAFTRITIESLNWEAHERSVIVEKSGKCKVSYRTPYDDGLTGDKKWTEKQLDKAKLADLINRISNANLFNMKEKYSIQATGIAEHYTVTFETVQGTRVFGFSNASKNNDVPKELLEIMYLIEWC
jgi:hypothetical protein